MGLSLSTTPQRTPLFAAHHKLGARLIDFGGWEMPVQYTSIVDEHLAVRNAAGVFDISHMGEVIVSGPYARQFLNGLLTNDVGKLQLGRAQYTLMCNSRGGTVDDLYLYEIANETYLMIINASRIDADLAWMQSALVEFPDRAGVSIENVSDSFGAVAVQGPKVVSFISDIFSGKGKFGAEVPTELAKNEIGAFSFCGEEVFVTRTGYTGEDGFEILAPAETIESIWNRVLDAGKAHGIKPCGLGARDTLRTEVCYPLYGHELDESTSPIEAGIGFFVSFDKGDFTGRSILFEQKATGVSKGCIAFKMNGKSAPPRPHYPIWSAGPDAKRIGDVVSGTQSPSLSCGIGLGYVPPQFNQPDTAIQIEIRGQLAPAIVVRKPFYKKKT